MSAHLHVRRRQISSGISTHPPGGGDCKAETPAGRISIASTCVCVCCCCRLSGNRVLPGIRSSGHFGDAADSTFVGNVSLYKGHRMIRSVETQLECQTTCGTGPTSLVRAMLADHLNVCGRVVSRTTGLGREPVMTRWAFKFAPPPLSEKHGFINLRPRTMIGSVRWIPTHA